jgi:hypothetical protein
MSELYERDFYGWTQAQAAALRRAAAERVNLAAPVDWLNLAEEVESMGREQAAKLRSSLRLLLMHLLKWRHQPNLQSRSWSNTIGRERDHIEECLLDNPGLKPRLAELLGPAYALARREAMRETGLPLRNFPDCCPWPLEQVMQDEWLPDSEP